MLGKTKLARSCAHLYNTVRALADVYNLKITIIIIVTIFDELYPGSGPFECDEDESTRSNIDNVLLDIQSIKPYG